MIRGINLGNQIEEEFTYFAFWDTVTDKFIEISGSQAWKSWDDCYEDCCFAELPQDAIARLQKLLPSIYKPA